MIEKITDMDRLYNSLSGKPDIFSGKIKALAESYGTGYDFLTFYSGDSGITAAKYYNSAVISGYTDNEEALSELKSFLPVLGKGTLMSSGLSDRLGISEVCKKGCIMKFTDKAPRDNDLSRDNVNNGLTYREIYDILKDGFDMSFDEWYVDINHNVRHGISRIFTVGNFTTASLMFSVDGISFISAVATRPEMRRKGWAGRLVRYIALSEAKCRNEAYLICEESLKGFYEKAGFTLSGNCYTIV